MTNRNPNNCATCDHKRHPQGGWCYMFKDEPTKRCMQHTALIELRFDAESDDWYHPENAL